MAHGKYASHPLSPSAADSENTLFLDETSIKGEQVKNYFTYSRIMLGLSMLLVVTNALSIVLWLKPTGSGLKPPYYCK